MNKRSGCALCAPLDYPALGLTPLITLLHFEVVRAHDDPLFPAWIRVISRRHAAEIAELSAAERSAMWPILLCIETCLHQVLAPAKINWASLGNRVAHVHWHLLARFEDDATWPDAPWSTPVRNAAAHALVQRLPQLDQAIVQALKGL